MEYELTDNAPAVVGGLRHSYNEACDGGPLYVSAGNGQYTAVAKSESAKRNPEQTQRQSCSGADIAYTGVNDGGHYATPHTDGPYGSIDDEGLYSKPQDGGLYASPDGADYDSPSSGHYDGVGGISCDYESTGGGSEGHYESLPCADSNIYEAIGSGKGNRKKHRKSDSHRATAATTINHQQHPPLPPPLPAPVANGGVNHTKPLDDFHYRVNNDEYAMVRKPNRQPSAISSSKSSSASLGRPLDQHRGMANGDAVNKETDVDGIESPYSQISPQHWKRRSAPVPQNGGWLQGNPIEDVV